MLVVDESVAGAGWIYSDQVRWGWSLQLRLDLTVIVMAAIVDEDGCGGSEFLKSWWWRKVVGGATVGSRVLMKRMKRKGKQME